MHRNLVLSSAAAALLTLVQGPIRVRCFTVQRSRKQLTQPVMALNNESFETEVTNLGCRRSFLSQGAVAGVANLLISSAVISQRPTKVFAEGTSAVLPSLGAKAPDFQLPNSKGDGSTTTLKALTDNNKWTVLYFYPGAFTQGCTLEAKGFQRDIDKYRELNTQIVGVSVDPVEKNASFCSQFGLDFYMLSDVGGKVSNAYGSALAVPGFGTFSNRQTYIIDPQGKLRWVFTDVESRVPRHSAEVLQKLSELTSTA